MESKTDREKLEQLGKIVRGTSGSMGMDKMEGVNGGDGREERVCGIFKKAGRCKDRR